MEKPAWTPIILSGTVPREATDLLAILVMGIVATEAFLGTIGLAAFSSRFWLSLLVVPPTCILASVSATTRRIKEELALFAYGGSGWQILLRYFFRGALCALIGFSPILIEGLVSSLSVVGIVPPVLALLLAGGLCYSLPSLRRIRSSSFVENYKS